MITLPMTYTDEQLVAASRTGRADAFGQLYDRYSDRIYKYHYYRTFHRETAEDLTSQTFIRTLEQLDKYTENKGNFSGWIYRIARNLLIDQVRKTRPTTDLEDMSAILHDSSDLVRSLEQKEQLDQIQASLSILTPEQREILLLRIWDERSYAEIATILKKSEASCKMSVSRALNQLRKAVPTAAFALLLHLLTHHSYV